MRFTRHIEYREIAMALATLVLLCLSGSQQPLAGQSVTVNIKASQRNYTVGSHVPVVVTATSDRMVQLRWPEYPDTMDRGLFLLKAYPIDTIKGTDGMNRYQQKLIVSAFDTGSYTIPAFDLGYQIIGKAYSGLVSTTPVTLRFSLVEMDEQEEIRDIKDPMKVGIGWTEIAPWFILVWALVLIAMLIRQWWIKRGRKAVPEISKPTSTATLLPWETAMAALLRLKQSALLADGQIKPYYTALSDILRIYLRDGLKIDAPELTTRETLHRLQTQSLVNVHSKQQIKRILELADMVKFAKAKPNIPESMEMLELAREFISGTAPVHIQPSKQEDPQ
jgi:hypothetical protein